MSYPICFYDTEVRRQKRAERRTAKSKGTYQRKLSAINWSKKDIPYVEKNFYREHSKITARSQKKVDVYRKDNCITISGDDVPRPVTTFKEIDFPDYISKVITALAYKEPTPIQAQGWPIALSGHNVVGIAQTGSGKTLSFILPAIVHINNQPRTPKVKDPPLCLVLVPTRELAQQVAKVAADFCEVSPIRSVCLYGGTDKLLQMQEVKKGTDLVIATPGRLIDLVANGDISLRDISYLVLDEADRMLDMGFDPQIRELIEQIRPDRQMLMWSATWPPNVRKIAEDYLKKYTEINIGLPILKANDSITQIIDVCNSDEKPSKLKELMSDIMESEDKKTIIFSTTKMSCALIALDLNNAGWNTGSIHGSKTQEEREAVLKEFKDGKVEVLVATDVAARGLDIEDIKYVINYDYPKQSEDYVHRIGRTGRATKTGTSYTFFTVDDSSHAADLINVLAESNQEIPPELTLMAAKAESNSFKYNRLTPVGIKEKLSTVDEVFSFTSRGVKRKNNKLSFMNKFSDNTGQRNRGRKH